MNELMDSVGPLRHDLSRDDTQTTKNAQQNESQAKLTDSSTHFTKVARFHKQEGQSEIASGEFNRGNLSGILRDSNKNMKQGGGLHRAHSGAVSKENLVDISTTSSTDKTI